MADQIGFTMRLRINQTNVKKLAYNDDFHYAFRYLPDEIRGDLDSIRPEVRSYYESKGVPITKIAEQDSHDFMKCVYLLKEKESELGKTFDVVALPALGGRFDQTIASINMLYMMKDEIERRVILVSHENLTILLDKAPLVGSCLSELRVRSARKDYANHPTYFGGMVSTSNIIDSDVIEIDTDSPLVWTIELNVNE
ncbi:cAMP-dependent protein kinase subunit [Apophysomyces sp. BC1034]|nr:cAMP-dependent protein kinase subunit [Apophysomyces sp. BC1021]KAG0187620.1 cAMP-dependent protein kinase subunit [Apophysomyces sp. BC1034]